MGLIHYLSLTLFFAVLSSCTVYKSADRKQFETDYTTPRLTSLELIHCSGQSIEPKATTSRIISIFEQTPSGDSVFLWEHKINSATSYFETNDLKGTYCVYENHH